LDVDADTLFTGDAGIEGKDLALVCPPTPGVEAEAALDAAADGEAQVIQEAELALDAEAEAPPAPMPSETVQATDPPGA
jgi:hypothetical protein